MNEAKFKVSELAAIKFRDFERPYIYKVEHVTPKGVVTCGGRKFKANGNSVGDGFAYAHILKVTPEILVEVRRGRMLETIAKFDFKTLRDGDLECVMNIINSPASENK